MQNTEYRMKDGGIKLVGKESLMCLVCCMPETLASVEYVCLCIHMPYCHHAMLIKSVYRPGRYSRIYNMMVEIYHGIQYLCSFQWAGC